MYNCCTTVSHEILNFDANWVYFESLLKIKYLSNGFKCIFWRNVWFKVFEINKYSRIIEYFHHQWIQKTIMCEEVFLMVSQMSLPVFVAPREACQGLNDSRLAKFQSFKVVNWPDSGSTKAGSFQNQYNQVIFWEYLLGSPSSQLMLMLLAWKGGRL